MSTKYLNIYCDGGARGNPGPAAAAFEVKDPSGRILNQSGIFLGHATNNQAEYQAVIDSLSWLLEIRFTKTYNLIAIHYFLDTQLLVNQLSGNFKVKEPQLRIKFLTAKQLADKLAIDINYSYIPRLQNYQADRLVNITLDNLH